MLSVAWAQLRHRPVRALVPFFGVVAAAAETGAPDPAASALAGWLLLACVAAEALVRGQRGDLAVLSRLGWPPRSVYALVLTQLAVVAGAGVVIGLPLGWEVR